MRTIRLARHRAAISLVGLVALAVAPVAAQPGAAARLYVFADTVDAGQRVAVAVAVDHPPGVQALFPEPPVVFPEVAPGLAFGDAEPLAVRRLPQRGLGAVRTDSVLYQTAVFAVDAARVGPVEVRLVASDGDTTVVRTGVAVVPVRVRAQATDLPPPPGDAWRLPSRAPHAVVASVLALLIAGAFGWRRRQRLAVPPDTPRLEPYPEAIARIDALADETDPEALADALKEAVRVYVARRVRVPTATRTTDELADALGAVAWLSDDARRRVRGVLRVTDLVDFAAWRPAPDALAQARDAARDAVEAVEADARAYEAAEAARVADEARAQPATP